MLSPIRPFRALVALPLILACFASWLNAETPATTEGAAIPASVQPAATTPPVEAPLKVEPPAKSNEVEKCGIDQAIETPRSRCVA